MRNRKWTDEDLIKAVASSKSIAETLRLLGLTVAYDNYKTVYRHIDRLGIDFNHHSGCSHPAANKIDLESILVKNSTYKYTTHLKNRLF